MRAFPHIFHPSRNPVRFLRLCRFEIQLRKITRCVPCKIQINPPYYLPPMSCIIHFCASGNKIHSMPLPVAVAVLLLRFCHRGICCRSLVVRGGSIQRNRRIPATQMGFVCVWEADEDYYQTLQLDPGPREILGHILARLVYIIRRLLAAKKRLQLTYACV
jgi:hypothetical protein